MKPIKHAKGEVTRQAILEAAEAVFAEVGYAAARLEDVANAVGIRRPSIVYYFAAKQELYDAVEADIFASMHAFSETRTSVCADPFERVIALLDAWLDFMVARPTAARIIQRLVADVTPRHGDPTQFSNSALEDIEHVIAAGTEAGAFAPIAPMHFLNGVAGSVLFYVCNGGQIGESRRYDPGDPQELARFRALLHRIAAAALMLRR
ncbi:MAG: TetR/AcrR family transcriptional regulator [Novosphingobium sp.]|nr:TetR/AcrR family transcriptional regulator [Novosphingobium sp.]